MPGRTKARKKKRAKRRVKLERNKAKVVIL